MQREADTVGFYDLLDAATGDVVYTVAKETDFASNMYHGAFTQSGFARVVQRALDPRKRAPKLLFDIVRFGLSVTWGSVVVSSIWNVNLGSIFAAMGVGSIAFALQEFLGNLLSGMGLLSAHNLMWTEGDPG
jgi:hypothetical protein